jgi:hypothetical protein
MIEASLSNTALSGAPPRRSSTPTKPVQKSAVVRVKV